MRRREFLKDVGAGLFSMALAPDLLSQVLVRSLRYEPPPFSVDDLDRTARVAVVGIGPSGAMIARGLSTQQSLVCCHEVSFDAGTCDLRQMGELLGAVRSCDLLFLASGLEDQYSAPLFRALGETARESGVLTVGVVPDQVAVFPAADWVSSIWPVSCRALGASVPSPAGPAGAGSNGWDAYTMRHLVTTISRLIHNHSLICVDFADVKAILSAGQFGRMGIGIAPLGDGASASLAALGRLTLQGCVPQEACAVLACISSSNQLTMADFDEASQVLHESISPDADIIVGLVFDEMLGTNMRITVLAVQDDGKSITDLRVI